MSLHAKAVVACLFIGAALIFGYHYLMSMFASDEDQISQRIRDSIAGAESGDLNAAMRIVSSNFVSAEGLDRSQFQMYIFSLMRSYQFIRVETREMKVELVPKSKEATVRYSGRISATAPGLKFPDSTVVSLKLLFKKYDKIGWLLDKLEEAKD